MFDEFIQSDEFATSWEEYQRYLDDLWEEPDEWRQVDTLATFYLDLRHLVIFHPLIDLAQIIVNTAAGHRLGLGDLIDGHVAVGRHQQRQDLFTSGI